MKIHLLGPSCSGTSTLGKLIAEKYEIPWYDSDDIFWIKTDPPFTQKKALQERIKTLQKIFKNNHSLVLSGSVLQWGDSIKESLDVVIYKYVEQDMRMNRLLARERQRYGDRINPGNDMHQIHTEFVEWAKKYELGEMEIRSKKSELAWIKNITCKIIMLEGNRPPEDELQIVIKAIEDK